LGINSLQLAINFGTLWKLVGFILSCFFLYYFSFSSFFDDVATFFKKGVVGEKNNIF
jgi:hypothetical protein